jgi:hypothetical protein
MKFVLKSKKDLSEVVGQGGDAATSFRVKIDPQLFLKLTPSDEGAQIDIRAASIGKFSKEKAGDMFLTVQPSSGKVVNHSGRARSQSAVKSGVSEIEITIRLPDGHGPVSWENLPDTFTQQDSQQKPGVNRVEKSMFHQMEAEQASDLDPLHIGGSTKTFSDEVLPAMTLPNGYRRPEMVTKQAEQIAKAFIKDAYAKYAESVKRNLGAISLDDAIAKSGLGHNEYVEKNITDFQNMFDSQYNISDESGELRFNYMDERYKGKPWSRQPVGAITIKRK